jgi:hypothetical protein
MTNSIVLKDNNRVYYGDRLIGTIRGDYTEGLPFVYVSAYVGGLQQGSCLRDMLDFAQQVIPSNPVEETLKSVPVPQRVGPSRVKLEADLLAMPSRTVKRFLRDYKHKHKGSPLRDIWMAFKVGWITRRCRKQSRLDPNWSQQVLPLVGYEGVPIEDPKKMIKILQGIEL